MASLGLAPLLALSLIFCIGVQHGDCECTNATALSTQLDAILSEYDREVPPATKVTVQLALDMRHSNINEYNNMLRLLADLHLTWQDSRLTWNVSELGCDWALGSAERLWIPDVTLVNAAASSSEDQPLAARLTSSGAVAWTKRLDVSIPIDMRLENWPNDVQTGVFKFASRAHDIDEIDLKIKNDQLQLALFESGAWEIVSLESNVGTVPSAGEEAGSRRLASWRLELRRRAASQLLAARAALAAALLLISAAALLPPSSRPPLAAAAAFITALWLCSAAWRVPRGVGPARAVLLAGAACGAAGALALCSALVLRVARLSTPAPGCVRAAVAAASRVLTLSPPPESGGGESCTWAAAACALDTLLLASLALALLVLLAVYL